MAGLGKKIHGMAALGIDENSMIFLPLSVVTLLLID
jgi:hypothetical protein